MANTKIKFKNPFDAGNCNFHDDSEIRPQILNLPKRKLKKSGHPNKVIPFNNNNWNFRETNYNQNSYRTIDKRSI